MKKFRLLACLLVLTGIPKLIAEEKKGGLIVNVRDFGAIGDGLEHSVREWIQSGRFSSINALRREIAVVSDESWSVDEAAFELAKKALPPEGGTIYFPRGTYVATARAWTIRRDHIRLIGDGADQTILATGINVMDGLVLAGYRHVGWSRGYPFASDDGAQGTDVLRLREGGEAAARFRTGQLVFIRNGANKYDQDYGEVNEVAQVTGDGRIRLVYPLSRDYTLAGLNWAGKTVVDGLMPPVGGGVRVAFARGTGHALPARGDIVSVAENIFRVESVAEPSIVRLVNVGRGNAASGSSIPAGSPVAKERGLVALEETTRGFRCEKLTLRGRRKALTVSNSYASSFTDCIIERVPDQARISGGIVIDGDDGRFVNFTRCEIRANPPCGIQFARSFGGAVFEDCRFINTNAAFTEFNFDCAVTRCTFDVAGGPGLQSVIIAGKSCNDLRIIGNTIRARDLAVIFDAKTDIQSFKVRGTGVFILRDNLIEANGVRRIYDLVESVASVVAGNTIRGQYGALGIPGEEASLAAGLDKK